MSVAQNSEDAGDHSTAEDSTQLPPRPEIAPGASDEVAGKALPLDGYRIIGQLGAGGMGVVWRALQVSTNRQVAIKVLNTGELVSDETRLRFKREIEIAGQLEHPNIARVYDSGIHRGVNFYVMELIEGVRLDQYVQGRELNCRGVLALMGTICRAVQHAHQKGIIHRDLKPSNILVDGGGNPHIVDFGLGKFLCEQAAGATISVGDQCVGTPAYMSPEQAAGRTDQIDTRTDIYSLGVILYQLLTGRLPHDTDGGHPAVLQRVAYGEIIRPGKASRRVDRELEAIILKAMSRKADERYRSPGELADDIERYLRGDPLTAQPPTTLYFLRKKIARHRVSFSLAAALIVGLICAIVFECVQLDYQHKRDLLAAESERSLRRVADLRLAESLIYSADALEELGRWREVGAKYWEAYQTQLANGADTDNAALGVLQAEEHAPLELNECTSGPHPVSLPLKVFMDPDGRTAWVLLYDGTARSIDLATGQTTRVLGHATGWQSMDGCASPDGLSISSKANVSDANRKTSTAIDVIDLREGNARRVSLSRKFVSLPQAILATNSDTLAVLAAQSTHGTPVMSLWTARMSEGMAPRLLASHTNLLLQAIAISPDLRTVATGDNQGQLIIYSLNEGTDQAAPAAIAGQFNIAETGGIQSMKFAPDSSGLLIGGGSGGIGFLDIASMRFRKFGDCNAPVRVLAFSRDGRLATSGSNDGCAYLWDVKTGECRESFSTGGRIVSLDLSPDNRTAVCATFDRIIRAWPIEPDETSVFRGGASPAGCIAVSPDDLLVAIGSSDQIQVVDRATGRNLLQFKTNGNVMSLAFSADSSTLDSASDRGEFDRFPIFNPAAAASPAGRAPLVLPNRDAPRAAPSPHGAFLAAGCNLAVDWSYHGASLVDLAQGRRIAGFAGNFVGIGCVSTDGRKAVGRSAMLMNVLEVIDTATGSDSQIRLPIPSWVDAVAMSGDGRTLFVATLDGKLHGIDVATRKEIWAAAGDQPGIKCLAASPRGATFLSGSADGVLKLRDALNGNEIRVVSKRPGPVSAITYSPRGDVIFCLRGPGGDSPNGTIEQWDLMLPAREREIGGAAAVGDATESLRFSPSDNGGLGDLTEWYALNGQYNWGNSLLDKMPYDALAGLAAARCRWQMNENAAAVAEFDALMERANPPAPVGYLKLCRDAAAASK